jgi:3-hydroxyisobutyrate dehydrogenase-like beta-hydroxyacid dehydrogenase
MLGLMSAGDHSPNYPIRLVAKDKGYAVAAAGGPVPIIEATRDAFRAAVEARLGDLDISGVGAPAPLHDR